VRPYRPSEPPVPRPREPFLTPRRTEPTPAAALQPPPRVEQEPARIRFEPKAETPAARRPAPGDEGAEKKSDMLDDFDAEMANLLGRTPSR